MFSAPVPCSRQFCSTVPASALRAMVIGSSAGLSAVPPHSPFWTSREPRPVNPRNHVPNLKPGILDPYAHAVLRPRPREREKMTPGFNTRSASRQIASDGTS